MWMSLKDVALPATEPKKLKSGTGVYKVLTHTQGLAPEAL